MYERAGPVLLLITATILSLPACTSFTRSWNESVGRAAEAGDRLEGCWEGEWQDDAEADPGRLMAVITRTGPGRYEARFRAKVARIFNHHSIVPLEVVDTAAEVWRFGGEKDLGFIAGGVYRHEGTSDGAVYESRYTSADHRGTFRMKRVSRVADENAFGGGFGRDFREDTGADSGED